MLRRSLREVEYVGEGLLQGHRPSVSPGGGELLKSEPFLHARNVPVMGRELRPIQRFPDKLAETFGRGEQSRRVGCPSALAKHAGEILHKNGGATNILERHRQGGALAEHRE